jgi:hypothetical protein
MHLWVDDLRPAPAGWVWAKTSRAAIVEIEHDANEPFTELSLDHDLGGDDTTRPLMLWMIEYDIWPDHIHVHTANPVGRDWLFGMAERYSPSSTTISK